MNIRIARQIIADTPLLSGIDGVQRIRKGFSRDAKYLLSQAGRPKYLLRLSGIEAQQRSRQEFDVQRRQYARGIPCPRPHLFGLAPGGAACYAIFEYLAGECAADILPTLSPRRQFAAGLAAGGHLRGLHRLHCPQPDFDWCAWQQKAYRKQVEQADKLGLAFPGQERVERYVEDHLDVLGDAPARFLHADYHPANLIVRAGRFAGIIDFNRCRWGDPAYDFKMLPLLTCPVSVPFARGQVCGYFDGRIRRDFWPRYNLYVAMSLHVTLVWPHQNDPRRLPLWRRRIQIILDTHDLQHSGPPAWFLQDGR